MSGLAEMLASAKAQGYKEGFEDAIEEYKKSECQKDSALVKAYEDGESNGWDAAIDAFVNNVSESIIWDILAEVMKRNIGASDGADKIIDYLQKIAEQLKGERNDLK